MYLVYYDEAGDDGYPKKRSDLFSLSGIYFHHFYWDVNFKIIKEFRKKLQRDKGINAKWEFHTRSFMENDKPFSRLNLSNKERVEILDSYCEVIASLKIKVVNSVIDKTAIENSDYPVLDYCLSYSLRRINNDLNYIEKNLKKEGHYTTPLRFLTFVDPGREGKMTKTMRRIKDCDYITSILFPGEKYRCDLDRLIEDAIPRISSNSYFIQISDFIVTVIYLYMKVKLGIGAIPLIIPREITLEKTEEWLDKLLPVLNTKASGENKYGIVCYPKKRKIPT